MSKFAVVVFPDERKAYEGVRALHELHRDATVTVFGAVVAHRSDGGALSLGKRSIEPPVGLGVLALAAGLVVLFGGPVDTGAFVFGCEGLVGGWRDHLHAGVTDDFLESVERVLVPGTFAVIAELSEESVFPLNTRVRALGGEVIRGPREDLVDDLLEAAANVRRTELVTRRAEEAAARAARTSSELVRAVGEARENLQRAIADIRERLDEARAELEAQVNALEEQAADAGPDVRSRIERRIAALHTAFAGREQRLERAYRVTRAAAPARGAATAPPAPRR
jgi:uncharacterized membrane protein